MKKALFIANIDSFHKNFHTPYIKMLVEQGYNVELVSTGNGRFDNVSVKHNIVFGRTPLEMKNIIAYKQLRKLFKGYYDIIYFSTPVVGAIGRMALHGLNHGRVIYSAHGFSFYKGNNKISNFKYRTIEKFLARYTDCIFTMNKEDFDACSVYKFKCKEIYNVDGVGVDLQKYSKPLKEEKERIRKQYGYAESDFIMIYPAELTERKNQLILINIIKELRRYHENIKLLLPGSGIMESVYQNAITENRLNDHIQLLGYRNDIDTLLKMSDILLASSLNEGLPINVIEAMAVGLPIVASDVRGHQDLVSNGINGFLYPIDKTNLAVDYINELIDDNLLYKKMSANCVEMAEKYSIDNVVPQYYKIFGIAENVNDT